MAIIRGYTKDDAHPFVTGEKAELLAKLKQASLNHEEPGFALPYVHLVLLTQEGKLILRQNPHGQYDMTAKDFVYEDEDPMHAVCRIADEQLGGLDLRVAGPESFLDFCGGMRMSTYAVVSEVGQEPWKGAIMSDVQLWTIRKRLYTYRGQYDGKLGVTNKKIFLRELRELAADNKLTLTHDLKDVIREYEDFLWDVRDMPEKPVTF